LHITSSATGKLLYSLRIEIEKLCCVGPNL
jgi:hypothetical protein